MGPTMFSRDDGLPAAAVTGGSSDRAAIDGLTAIATALDQGIDATTTKDGMMADAAAIVLGWLVLATMIFYPVLQLAAILVCVVVICMRSLSRHAYRIARRVAAVVAGSFSARQSALPDGP
jgi:lysophospholipid acyltransferase (LPLAT)-like uncharacterized protein